MLPAPDLHPDDNLGHPWQVGKFEYMNRMRPADHCDGRQGAFHFYSFLCFSQLLLIDKIKIRDKVYLDM